jgi:hypothetical protein
VAGMWICLLLISIVIIIIAWKGRMGGGDAMMNRLPSLKHRNKSAFPLPSPDLVHMLHSSRLHSISPSCIITCSTLFFFRENAG